jgi:hypothetical protein
VSDNDSIKRSQDFEHQYLRNEIETNKQMIFERALLIAGTALAATILPKEANGIELLGIPAIAALAFNFWLSVNRLRSNMRIVAYIQLFHESENEMEWIGWENSLRIYRIWLKKCEDEYRLSETLHSGIDQYDNLSFYIPIRYLHIAMAFAISSFMSFRVWTVDQHTNILWNDLSLWVILLNIAAFIFFLIWILSSSYFRPKDLLYGIEKNRIRWVAVFKSYKSGRLKETLANEAKQPAAQGYGPKGGPHL